MEVFRNRSAAILWGFFVCFGCASAAFAWIILRSGSPAGMSWQVAAGLCASCWLVTAALGYAASRIPFVHASLDSDGTLTVTLRHGLRKERKVFSAASVQDAKLVVTEDSEGLPYHRAEVTAGDQVKVTIAEGTRHKCERACARFNRVHGAIRRRGLVPG